jgi:zinc/manganese transport system substrate-binding protein
MRPRWSTLISSLVLAGLLAAGCGSTDDQGADAAADGPTIVVTTTILGDLVQRLTDGDARVQVLMPPGADPHDFEPSAAQAASVRSADLVIANGLGLEERLLDTVDAAAADGVPVVEVAPLLDPVPFTEPDTAHDAGGAHDAGEVHAHDHGDDGGESHDHAHDGHGHDGDDPHVWLDPERMARAAELLAGEIAEATDVDAIVLQERAAVYAADARAAEAEARRLLDAVPPAQRVLVSNHDALGYFARRFDLRLVGVVIPGGSTMAEPSPSEIAELAARVRDSGARAVFAEHTVAPTIVEALAREAGGVRVVQLYTDSLGEEGGPAATYGDMIVENARLVAEGLTGAAR